MKRTQEGRQGAAAVEFALALALVLIPIMAGVWDISKFIDINHVLARAAREGVIMASRGHDPTEAVRECVSRAGLMDQNLDVAVTTASNPGLGQEVQVELAYDFSGYTIFPWEEFMPQGVTTAAVAKME
ncbi:TadE/TadG family type IV pilus assembly protein [Pseudodesulfovibrio tunisiensis]|uniref:TadE/TadG family type IV pilus assembly protein n=1 Tax=Pseudodesulfovibrio tunisiensis TaxID=463192 RepID=UPI001FB3858F|nr:TadE/TadG family type IV pilus assembly protein [Pseudodesulfovibrio tunisiensis]